MSDLWAIHRVLNVWLTPSNEREGSFRVAPMPITPEETRNHFFADSATLSIKPAIDLSPGPDRQPGAPHRLDHSLLQILVANHAYHHKLSFGPAPGLIPTLFDNTESIRRHAVSIKVILYGDRQTNEERVTRLVRLCESAGIHCYGAACYSSDYMSIIGICTGLEPSIWPVQRIRT